MVLWAEGPEGAKTQGLQRTDDSGCSGAFKEPRSWGCPAAKGGGPLAVGRGRAPDLCVFWGVLSS